MTKTRSVGARALERSRVFRDAGMTYLAPRRLFGNGWKLRPSPNLAQRYW